MKRFSSLLALAVVTMVAMVGQTALANGLDRFWDAFTIQGATKLDATYKESPENGLIDQTMDIDIEDAPHNAMLLVTINNIRFGTIRTNAFGDGTLFRARLNQPVGGDGRPTGPRIEDGDVLRVFNRSFSISATFQERP